MQSSRKPKEQNELNLLPGTVRPRSFAMAAKLYQHVPGDRQGPCDVRNNKNECNALLVLFERFHTVYKTNTLCFGCLT